MNEIIDALPGLGAVGLAAGLVAAHRLIFGDPDANQHDVSDYKPTLAPARRNWPLVDKQDDVVWGMDDDILPPAPEGMNAGSPLYAGMLFDTWQQERWGTTNPAAIAAQMLRDNAAEQVTR